MKQNLIILDCETGGTDETQNPITEVALKVLEPVKFKQLDEFQTYVAPYENLIITKEAIAATQLNMDKINNGALLKVVVVKLIAIFKKHTLAGSKGARKPVIGGHNTHFDIKFLKVAFALCGKDLFDYIDEGTYDTRKLMELRDAGKVRAGEIVRYTLTACCERMGISLKSAHGAEADVIATIALIKAIAGILRAEKGASKAQEEIKTEKSRTNFRFEF